MTSLAFSLSSAQFQKSRTGTTTGHPFVPRFRGQKQIRRVARDDHSLESFERRGGWIHTRLRKGTPGSSSLRFLRVLCAFAAAFSFLVLSRHSALVTRHFQRDAPLVVHAQNLDKPVQNIDEEVTSFAYAPDGRIVFSVRRMYKAKKYDLQRDDIWLLEGNGKRRRLFNGEKFTMGDKPFTYQVESFTWSPNGKILAVQLFTTSVNIEDGRTEDARALLFVDDSGRELHPAGKEPLVMGLESPLWLRDNGTAVVLKEEVTPRELFSMQYLYMSSGTGTKAFEGRTFRAAERIPGSNSAIAVERDRNMAGPPRLQKLELLAQEDKELATLDAYAGGLSVSPSGTKAAYYLDKEVLEIRDLGSPNKLARLRVGLGVLQWNAAETRIYLKRTIEKKSADLVSVAVPPLSAYSGRQQIPVQEPLPQVLLHGLTVREFGISPDGRFLAVVLPGKRNLQVFGF